VSEWNTLEPDLIIWFESGAYWKGWWMDECMDGWMNEWLMNENHFFVEALVAQLGSCNGTSLVNSFFTFPSIYFLIYPILAYYCGLKRNKWTIVHPNYLPSCIYLPTMVDPPPGFTCGVTHLHVLVYPQTIIYCLRLPLC
jgi:hypothetical protein